MNLRRSGKLLADAKETYFANFVGEDEDTLLERPGGEVMLEQPVGHLH